MRKPSLPSDSLAYALRGAAAATALVQSGTALPQALARIGHAAMPAQARGAVQDLAYRSMRHWGTSHTLLKLLVAKPPPAAVGNLLTCALALLQESENSAPYPAFTVVDQTVAAAASDAKTAHAKGLINAVLRRFLREREALLPLLSDQPEAHWNYPAWWITHVQSAYPAQWQDILAAGNAAPPLTLRVNRRKIDTRQYLEKLLERQMEADQIGPCAVRLTRPLPVQQIPGFNEGLVSVQDAAAQLAAPLLDVRDGMRVLDACAAPGGKTGHLLETANVDLLALDSDAERLRRVSQNLKRLQLSARLLAADAAGADWWDGKAFDRILADVPCTASGIVRRHPDIRWLRRPEDADRLATLSAQILDNLWQMLGPNGKLLLVTCSLWPQESEAQAISFAKRHHAMRLPAPGQLLPTVDASRDHDGLFYALFQKPPA